MQGHNISYLTFRSLFAYDVWFDADWIYVLDLIADVVQLLRKVLNTFVQLQTQNRTMSDSMLH